MTESLGYQPAVRIRGIYATALTHLLLGLNATIVQASPPIRERFDLPDDPGLPDLDIRDRGDRQGVVIAGAKADIAAARGLIHSVLPRAVFRPASAPAHRHNRNFQESAVTVEFPATEKQILDETRRSVMPTIVLHHQLKTLDSDSVDAAERQLESSPSLLNDLSERLYDDLIVRHFRKGQRVVIQHVKPAGQEYELKGALVELNGNHLLLERKFYPGGHYDSLNVPRLSGDYGHLELDIGSGTCIRSYRRATGELLGDLHNLATPAELYPGHIRYVDLELDVLQMAGGPPRLVDEDDLARAIARGYLSEALVADAWRLADEVITSCAQ